VLDPAHRRLQCVVRHAPRDLEIVTHHGDVEAVIAAANADREAFVLERERRLEIGSALERLRDDDRVVHVLVVLPLAHEHEVVGRHHLLRCMQLGRGRR